jgi:lipase maturation factor 1
MIYDGDCNFCSLWISRWRNATGQSVDYLPFQDARIAAQFPELSRTQCEAAVQLVEPDGSVYGGAEAVFRALAHEPREHWLLDWYYHSAAFAGSTEWGYRLVARHRKVFSALTRLGWGQHVERPSYFLVRWLFLRALGIIYLIAFFSLWSQIMGLVGSEGILPAKSTMATLRMDLNAQGIGLERYHLMPTLCWFTASDGFIKLQCALGTGLAVMLILGVAPAICLFLLWLIYLSLSTVCGEFLAFQWDNLLLQAGFLAIFLAPLQFRPGLWRQAQPSRLMVWLMRWLLFQLMFESGWVKLASGDPSWRGLTALQFHYETQPLPTWLGWYAFQLPAWVQSGSAAIMFVVELAVPFLIFGPRRPRHFACVAFVVLQVMIMLTGNYGFFNLLTMALCLLLLDDAAVRPLFQWTLRKHASGAKSSGPGPADNVTLTPDSTASVPGSSSCFAPCQANLKAIRWPSQITIPLACLSLAISLMHFGSLFRLPLSWPRPLLAAYRWLGPLRTFNSYGLFAVMTTQRHEITIEGSKDGATWLPYEFKYKPGDFQRRPAFVEPHQPRLDWQMWFAGLSDPRRNPWLINTCIRLLQRSPSVLALLKRDPFPTERPQYVRAVLYGYHFTNWAERRKTGAWWRREKLGDYLPAMTLRNPPPNGENPIPVLTNPPARPKFEQDRARTVPNGGT